MTFLDLSNNPFNCDFTVLQSLGQCADANSAISKMRREIKMLTMQDQIIAPS